MGSWRLAVRSRFHCGTLWVDTRAKPPWCAGLQGENSTFEVAKLRSAHKRLRRTTSAPAAKVREHLKMVPAPILFSIRSRAPMRHAR